MSLWNRVAVVGLPGVGKSSLCQTANRDLGYHYINYGELMLDLAQKHGWASDLDEMLLLDNELQFQIWDSAAEKTINIKNSLIDLHGVDLVNAGYLISLPFEKVPPELIIILKSSYDDLLQRRINDPGKVRILERQKAFIENYNILLKAMTSISAFIGCNLIIIENKEWNIALNNLKEVLKNDER